MPTRESSPFKVSRKLSKWKGVVWAGILSVGALGFACNRSSGASAQANTMCSEDKRCDSGCCVSGQCVSLPKNKKSQADTLGKDMICQDIRVGTV